MQELLKKDSESICNFGRRKKFENVYYRMTELPCLEQHLNDEDKRNAAGVCHTKLATTLLPKQKKAILEPINFLQVEI